MIKIKQWKSLFLLVAGTMMLSGCSKTVTLETLEEINATEENTAEVNNISDKKKYSVVCTTFFQYDWIKNILQEDSADYEITILQDNGVDLHSYQPTVADIALIAESDLFVYVGGHSDGWVEDALKGTKNPNQHTVNLLEVLGNKVKLEEIVEGMEAEDEHDHETEEVHETEEDHETEEVHEEEEYDEHVWLSLKNALVLTTSLSSALEQIKPDQSEYYQSNLMDYQSKLSDLDKEYEQMVDQAKRTTVLFGDRFPFRYLVDDYGISYYAAFAGCSAETEASFETIAFLSGKMDELKLPYILILEDSSQTIANTILTTASGKGKEELILNSMQSMTEAKIKEGITYLEIMESNKNILEKALN